MQILRIFRKKQQPPKGTDWIGYENLLKFIELNDIQSVEGDFVEIGTFLGGGAYKLSKYLKKVDSSKRLIVIDIFDPNFDLTTNDKGRQMKSFYFDGLKKFGGRSQHEIFCKVTEHCDNIVVLASDSKKVVIPSECVSFGFIDGNHAPEYVSNDFYLIWNKLSSNGAVAFHDYNGDLPQTTDMINTLVKTHMSEIKKTSVNNRKHIIFIVKK